MTNIKETKNKNQSAFTVVELLVSTAIVCVMIILVMQAMVLGSKGLFVTGAQTKTNGESRMGMEKMTRELRNAHYSDISTPTSSSLQFKIPSSVASDGTITWSGYYQYSLGGTSNQQLLRTDVSAGTTKIYANKITGITFTPSATTNSLAIAMTAQESVSGGSTIPATLAGTVEFRN